MNDAGPAARATACLTYMTAFYATMSLVGAFTGATLVMYAGIAGLTALATSVLVRRWWTAYLVIGSYALAVIVAALYGRFMLAVASALSAALYFTSLKAVESGESRKGRRIP